MSVRAAIVTLGVAGSAFGLAAPIAPANVATRQAIGSARHVATGSMHPAYYHCYWYRGRRVCVRR
jgi:hypothetical protein